MYNVYPNKSNKVLKILLFFPIILLVFDMVIGSFEDRTNIVLTQVFTILSFVIIVIINKKILLITPSSILFLNYIYLLIILCIINYLYYIYSTIYQIGSSAYRDQLMFVGYQPYASQFVFPIIAISVLYFTKHLNINRIYQYLFVAITIVIMLLSFRRTNFLILIIGIIFLIFSNNEFRNAILKFIPFFLILFFLNQDFIMTEIQNNLESRSRITNVENYYEELRVIESILVFEKVSKDIKTLFFGTGNMWNSEGRYGLFTGDHWTWERPIHNDYANLLFGGGLIALLLYFCFIASLLITILKINKLDFEFHKALKTYLIFLCLILAVNGLSSGLTDIMYRSTISLLIGGGIGILIRQISQRNHSYARE
jgi:hypothetical protein